jgi:catechol 2,3-dioxygenase-like lactoylglutathione lyase family enzyme
MTVSFPSMRILIPVLALVWTLVPAVAPAQLVAAKDGPIAYGHHHINVSDLAAHRKFWVDGLGGTPVVIGTSKAERVKFRNVLVFFTEQKPTGGTKGTVVNHVGFEVPNLRAAIDRLKGAGFAMATAAESPATAKVADDIATNAAGGRLAFVLGPDETKVELIENTAVPGIVMHHIHWAAPDVAAMKAWYVQMFGAKPGMRGTFEAGDLPGVNLTFGGAAGAAVVPTKGRALDHIGFEVRNLEQLVKDLEAKGVKFDRPYTKVPALGIAIAFLTDPWGTYIELTEGLAAVQ